MIKSLKVWLNQLILKNIVDIHDRILKHYHISWFYKMPPQYKPFYYFEIKHGNTKPTGFRNIFKWYPYFFGDDIKIEIELKSELETEIKYSYQLIESNTKKLIFNEEGKLTKNSFGKNLLNDYINFPLSNITLSQYIFEIKFDNYLGWQQIMFFEIHGDKTLLTIIAISIAFVSLILGFVVRGFI